METILTLRQEEFNRRYERLPFATKQHLQKKNNAPPNQPIHVVYVLNHTGVCGGVKVILEHAHYLALSGIKVTLISHFERPTWLKWEGQYLQVPFTKELTYDIPECDIIVATYWDHIQACIETHIAPVIYFEQGDYHLFERHTIVPELLNFIDTQFTLPNFFMTVSTPIAALINTLYSQHCEVIPNAINTDYFNLAATPFEHPHPYILMLGADETPFKGLNEIRLAFRYLKMFLPYLDLIWITPSEPSLPHFEAALTFVNPPQPLIAQLYKGALAFVSASHYESFSLPALEAMSCGCPVITTNNLGVSEYALH
ncbi:MAG: glycosyltransferase family 4 protein, partial [Planctomycetia bacterium]|nr:glycosyltransferase family 4 protein [Planctomycetia bacterium]